MKLFILLVAVVATGAKRLPPNFQKCNRKDADVKSCVLKAAQNGIAQLTQAYPDVNIPNLNPIEIPSVFIGAGNGSVVGVDQKFTNCKLWGFHRMKVDQFEFNFEKKTFEAAGSFPEIVLKGDYELDGKVLLLPIKGTGPGSVILSNLKVHALLKFEEVKRKNKTYMKFVSSELTLDPDHVSFNFDNLFNGDKTLGDNVNKVLNDNWKEVFDEVKPSYIELINKILNNLFNNFFSKVSIEEAFD